MLQKKLLLAFVLSFGVSAAALAQMNCSDVKNKNQDECVRAKANNNRNLNCSDVKNKNQDECVRAKVNNNGNMNNVDCKNAKDADVRQACRKAKY